MLNTGVSTVRALAPAAEVLAADGILHALHRHPESARADGESRSRKQEGGTHADEIETSMMLYMAPATSTWARPSRTTTRERAASRAKRRGGEDLLATGVFGDATLATREKGRVVTEALVEAILKEIEELAGAVPPARIP